MRALAGWRKVSFSVIDCEWLAGASGSETEWCLGRRVHVRGGAACGEVGAAVLERDHAAHDPHACQGAHSCPTH
eukprot:47643-Rhodomonas_salina.3